MLLRLLLIAVFGALGALARAGVAALLTPPDPARLPLGTIAVNLVGSFLLGLLAGLALAGRGPPEPWRAALGAGFLGGLTTFSTFSVETVRLAEAGSWRLAALNLALQIGLGLPAALAGLALGRAST